MSLYDDFDKHRTTDKVAGWSSGIKLLQSQLQLKKAAIPHGKREQGKKSAAVLAPVIDLKSKVRDNEKEDDGVIKYFSTNAANPIGVGIEYDWNVVNEYDPSWPNEYDKVVKELRDIRDREHDQENEQRKRRRETTHFEENQMSNIAASINSIERDEERSTFRNNPGGATIAPPPSLQDVPEIVPPISRPNLNQGYATSSVAAKIMAKYGFKEGQGLGKKEQGMSVALQVEKTSKRGGRIVSEKEQLMPPPLPLNLSPPSVTQMQSPVHNQEEPSITEIMKSPSKVVLLRNMVGPGEVDDDLEPEVKDECNTKYGDVTRVVIHEVIDAHPEEAVRIFVEFKRIESAIKAVVDLNGRFFGGRQVKAGFYSIEKLNNFQLLD
ncbi:PREDICTED: splicing factor 45 [Ceratosolen solmsi marchali]|uniref:Splicing factor 45 n=1 Tax=Ceratosolen solmsi marchali TaxID=326594 RepID=A0AAJ7DX58_9HYME|nr:PREDICTED: splicing factor 45 [Ceratosolen solmsi marchali]